MKFVFENRYDWGASWKYFLSTQLTSFVNVVPSQPGTQTYDLLKFVQKLIWNYIEICFWKSIWNHWGASLKYFLSTQLTSFVNVVQSQPGTQTYDLQELVRKLPWNIGTKSISRTLNYKIFLPKIFYRRDFAMTCLLFWSWFNLQLDLQFWI